MAQTEFVLTEEQKQLLVKIHDALERGDEEEASRLTKILPIAPHIALTLKDLYGAQFVIDQGYNLTFVEQQYGQDWINQ